MKVSDNMAKAKNNNPRIHEISKMINVSSKDLIALLAEYGIEVKNHMTVLEFKEIDIILTTYLNRFDRGDTIEEYYASVKAEKQAEELLPKIADLGFRGIHYIDVISLHPPRKCYSKKHFINKNI